MSRRGSLPGLGVLFVVVVIAVGSFFVLQAGAADKGEVVISTSQVNDSWDGGPFTGGVLNSTLCAGDVACDSISLRVDESVNDAYWDTHRGGIEVQVVPDQAANADFDISVQDKDGTAVSAEQGKSAGSTTERLMIPKASSAKAPYKITVVPYTGAVNATYKAGVRLESREAASADDVPTEPVSDKPCVNGKAAGFPCKGVDLEGFLPLKGLDLAGDPAGGNLNDIWGWTDPSSGREYALVGKVNGTAFVDVTDAKAPKFLGELPGHQKDAQGQPIETMFNTWRDIKVYKDHAYIVSEEPSHGMQVFDLKDLRGVTTPQTFDEAGHYSYLVDGIGSVPTVPDPDRGGLFTGDNAHNIAINEESGVAYVIGTSTCAGGGSHMIDISQPDDPQFLGCDSTDSYTHDNQCVNYAGPDTDHTGDEVCFNSNEDTVTVAKVAEADGTRLGTPEVLSRVGYPEAKYTHQGWLTSDSKRFLVNDELDEQEGGQTRTQTYIWNVEDLDAISLQAKHSGETPSIDHNQYVKGDRVFQSHYRSGVRILDSSQAGSGALTEKGFFDVYPEDDEAEFNGSWSNYPYFKSGIVIATGIEQGLFVLRPSEGVGAPGNATSAGNVGAAAPTTNVPVRPRRLRVGFGRHLYGDRVRKGRFPVQCRQSTTARRKCHVVVTRTVKGKPRAVGSGSAFIRRSGRVNIKLTAYGRKLRRVRPKGTAIRLQARARDDIGLVTGNKRGKLRR